MLDKYGTTKGVRSEFEFAISEYIETQEQEIWGEASQLCKSINRLSDSSFWGIFAINYLIPENSS